MKSHLKRDCCLTLIIVASFNAFLAIADPAPLRPVTTLDASQAPSDSAGGDSGAPIISPDGHYVLFASTASNLVMGSNNIPLPTPVSPTINVFLRNRTNGTTILVSYNLAGTGGGNGDSLPVNISTNGRYATFESRATDLVSNDTNNASDIFMRDLSTGTTTLISVGTNGSIGNAESRNAAMTPNGRYVAFVSAANNLAPNDTNGIPDIFVRDIQTGTTTLASVGAKSALASSSSEAPDITPDGRYVAFYSTATNLVPNMTNTGDIYLRDLVEGTTSWASKDARSILGKSQAVSFSHSLSSDGQFVAYETSQIDSSANPTGVGVILRYSRSTGQTDLVNTNANISLDNIAMIQTLDMTPDGRFIAFVGNVTISSKTTCINIWDSQSPGTVTLASCDISNAIPASTFCERPTLDSTGQFVAFLADAAYLSTNVTAPGPHLYLRDLSTGTSSLIDRDTNGIGSATPLATSRLSANGKTIAFACPDGKLVPKDQNRCSDVFVRDTTNNAVELVSIRHPMRPSLSPNGPSANSAKSISVDGRYVAFSSMADNLVAGDTNGCRDIYVYDFLGTTNLLVSVASNGANANGPSLDPTISPEGRYVAFSSWATNLVSKDANYAQDVFVRDLQTGTTTLISANSSGTGSGSGSSTPLAISPGGGYVLFTSTAKDLSATTVSTGNNLFIRDTAASKTYALSTYGSCNSGLMTPDGRFVAFQDGSSYTLYIWDTQASTKVYTNTTASISSFALSPDGNRIVLSIGSAMYLIDRAAKTKQTIITSLTSGSAMQFSQDGRFLIYKAYQGAFQVFLYDFQTGQKKLISQNAGIAANAGASDPSFGFGNRFIAYSSRSTNLVAGATNGVPNIFLYDLQTGVTDLLSASQADGSTSSGFCFTPMFSGDGKTLIFESWGSNLTAQDSNQSSDLFAFTVLCAGISTETSQGQGLGINWLTVPGKTNRVQFKTNLNDPNWQNLPGSVSVQGNRGTLLDPGVVTGQRFYRIVVE